MNADSPLSGLITYQHISVPVEREVIHYDGYEITILKMYRSSVEKVGMRLLEVDNIETKEKEG